MRRREARAFVACSARVRHAFGVCSSRVRAARVAGSGVRVDDRPRGGVRIGFHPGAARAASSPARSPPGSHARRSGRYDSGGGEPRSPASLAAMSTVSMRQRAAMRRAIGGVACRDRHRVMCRRRARRRQQAPPCARGRRSMRAARRAAHACVVRCQPRAAPRRRVIPLSTAVVSRVCACVRTHAQPIFPHGRNTSRRCCGIVSHRCFQQK